MLSADTKSRDSHCSRTTPLITTLDRIMPYVAQLGVIRLLAVICLAAQPTLSDAERWLRGSRRCWIPTEPCCLSALSPCHARRSSPIGADNVCRKISSVSNNRDSEPWTTAGPVSAAHHPPCITTAAARSRRCSVPSRRRCASLHRRPGGCQRGTSASLIRGRRRCGGAMERLGDRLGSYYSTWLASSFSCCMPRLQEQSEEEYPPFNS